MRPGGYGASVSPVRRSRPFTAARTLPRARSSRSNPSARRRRMASRGVGEIVMNPMAVSRGNALRRGNRILGVVVQRDRARGQMPRPSSVNIKLWLRQLKRGTRAYRNVMESARELKGVFDEMIAGQGNGLSASRSLPSIGHTRASWNTSTPHGLSEGDRLPSERELCVTLDVSRTTLRSALAELSAHHIVDCKPGAGSFVCPAPSDHPPRRPLGLQRDRPQDREDAGLARRMEGRHRLSRTTSRPRLALAAGDPVFQLRRVRCVEDERRSASRRRSSRCVRARESRPSIFRRNRSRQPLESRYRHAHRAHARSRSRWDALRKMRRRSCLSPRATSSSSNEACARTTTCRRLNTMSRCTCPSASASYATPCSSSPALASAGLGGRCGAWPRAIAARRGSTRTPPGSICHSTCASGVSYAEKINGGEFTPGAAIPSESDLFAAVQHDEAHHTQCHRRPHRRGAAPSVCRARVHSSRTASARTVRRTAPGASVRVRAICGTVRAYGCSKPRFGRWAAHYARLFDVSSEGDLYQVRRLNCRGRRTIRDRDRARSPANSSPASRRWTFSLFSLYEFYALRGHEVVRAIEDLQVCELKPREAQLLRGSVGDPALGIRCVSYDAAGRALEYVTSVAIGEHARYSVSQ